MNSLPAASVIAAATAFGLTTLLPLNVPMNSPLIYCGRPEITQARIKFYDVIYYCANETVRESCPKEINGKIVDDCKKKQCNELDCSHNTLIADLDMVCNSTYSAFDIELNSTVDILECFTGWWPENLSSFIPTTTETPKKKKVSLKAYVHMLMLDFIGQSEVYESTTRPPYELKDGEESWIPEALTLPPGYVIPEENYPFYLEYQVIANFMDGRSAVIKRKPVDESVEKVWLKLHLRYGVPLPPFIALVPLINENPTTAKIPTKRDRIQAEIRNQPILNELKKITGYSKYIESIKNSSKRTKRK